MDGKLNFNNITSIGPTDEIAKLDQGKLAMPRIDTEGRPDVQNKETN